MSITINAVIQSGIVKWPALRYDGSGKPEFRFVLYRETTNAEGQTFPLSIPCCSPGATGERLAEELNEGDFVVVTVGELVYRRRDTKDGEKSRLEILVWRVQKDDAALATSAVGPLSADHAEPESTTEPPAKVRRPRVPKIAQQPWPSGLVSEN
jgi:single-stranded DNA-binding protein